MIRIPLLAIAIVTAMFDCAFAAGPFDGKWIGETPSAGACGVWKFDFTVTDNNVSGSVEGLLNGRLATGAVLSGVVKPDGTAQVLWGEINAFQGGFRFAENAWSGRVVTACGETTMSGRRAQS